jgi:hypothetical protein
LFELDPGAAIEANPGWLFGSGTDAHPVISNAAFRIDDEIAAEDFLARAQAYFDRRDRRFSVWVRGDEAADIDLLAAACSIGLVPAYQMPEMILGRPVVEPELPKGVELRRVETAEDAEAYWRVAASAYASLGFPSEIFASYRNHHGLVAKNVVAFLAHLDGKPVSVAMAIVSHGVAGIYWVGTIKGARGEGLGRAATAAATNAGLELGAEIASLQASPMGEPLYLAMGYERIFSYRLLISPSP